MQELSLVSTPEFLTYADRMQVERRSLTALIREGQRGDGPPKTRLGRRVLFARSEYLTWLKSREEKHPVAAVESQGV